MKKMFIALLLAEKLELPFRESVRPFLKQLGQKGVRCRIPPPGNDHVTLAFLGQLDEAGEALAKEAMSTVTAASFELRWRAIDSFPNRRSARVAFAAFESDDRVQSLHRQLDQALRQRGFILEDRPFVPHLTIARLGRPVGLDSLLGDEWKGRELPPLPVDRIVLYESRSGPFGQVYLETFSFNLSDGLEGH